MTLPRLAALARSWREHPPTHLLLAAWLGYRPTAPSADLTTFVAAFPGAVAG